MIQACLGQGVHRWLCCCSTSGQSHHSQEKADLCWHVRRPLCGTRLPPTWLWQDTWHAPGPSILPPSCQTPVSHCCHSNTQASLTLECGFLVWNLPEPLEESGLGMKWLMNGQSLCVLAEIFSGKIIHSFFSDPSSMLGDPRRLATAMGKKQTPQ